LETLIGQVGGTFVGQVGTGKRVLGTGSGIAVEVKEVYTYTGEVERRAYGTVQYSTVRYVTVRCG
jgi:hypothetical protein